MTFVISWFKCNCIITESQKNIMEMECDYIFFAVLLGCSSFIFSSVIVVDLFFVQIIFFKILSCYLSCGRKSDSFENQVHSSSFHNLIKLMVIK